MFIYVYIYIYTAPPGLRLEKNKNIAGVYHVVVYKLTDPKYRSLYIHHHRGIAQKPWCSQFSEHDKHFSLDNRRPFLAYWGCAQNAYT